MVTITIQRLKALHIVGLFYFVSFLTLLYKKHFDFFQNFV